MNTKAFGALAACAAALAVLLCVLTVALELPLPIEIGLIIGALVLLVAAGGLVGAAVAAHRRPSA
ncbi:hypothetical protein ACFT30_04010 [Microbacterium ureisolvens]|uniref:hypothetical protein n=1 Tax=Microbacterium ureisolvens TaxID=2781186 RepID=UPI0036412DD2